jgi:uncharacterized protein (TIGR03382 family)
MSHSQAAPRVATILTMIVLVLLPVATLVALVVPHFYRDTAWMIPQARGQDLVTLVLVEPLLLGALLRARASWLRPQLVWAGALGYVLYTYAMYSYTTYFNVLFLVYVALFSASLFALVDLLLHLDLTPLRAGFPRGLPRRLLIGYCAFVGLFFLAAWLGQIIPATLHNTVPDVLVLAKTPTSAVHVQDLAVVLPLFFLAAVWLWRRRPWGVALGAILIIVADVMMVAILTMGYYSARAGIMGALDMAPVFAPLTLASLGVTALVYARLPTARPANGHGEVPLVSGAVRATDDRGGHVPEHVREPLHTSRG